MFAATTHDLWYDHLTQARWFQAKGLAIKALAVTPLPWYVQGDDLWLRSELAQVDLGERSETYHLLVAYQPCGLGDAAAVIGQTELAELGPVDVLDAPHSPRAMGAFLAAAADGQAAVTWYEAAPDPANSTKVFAGEQSNTTITVGSDVLLKLFRKLNPYPNPEASILADLAGSGITPRLIGTWSQGEWDLGFFCERIPAAQDGWAYGTRAAQADQSMTVALEDLGRTLKTLHETMATVYGTSRVAAAAIQDLMVRRLDDACERLSELSELAAPLRQALVAPAGEVQIQRVHGDFHLAQALSSARGWTIIDFEGEPLKSPAERVAPDTVWRDVAGLLRSLDYARCSHPDPDGPSGRQWYESGRDAFLRGYLGDTTAPSPLLTAYEIDKAIYEVEYETRNRPSWAAIPLRMLASVSAAG